MAFLAAFLASFKFWASVLAVSTPEISVALSTFALAAVLSASDKLLIPSIADLAASFALLKLLSPFKAFKASSTACLAAFTTADSVETSPVLEPLILSNKALAFSTALS